MIENLALRTISNQNRAFFVAVTPPSKRWNATSGVDPICEQPDALMSIRDQASIQIQRLRNSHIFTPWVKAR